jgi:hypothetical protein
MTTLCHSCGCLSEDPDWCDDCGRPIVASEAPQARPAHACPVCGEPEEGRFCQDCGYDFAGGPPDADPISGDTELSPVRGSQTHPSAPPTPASGPAPTPPSGPVFDDDTARAATGLSGAVPPGPFQHSGFAVVVSADRAFHARLADDPEAAPFPPYAPTRTIPLAGNEVRIGRGRRGSADRPEIDLSEPPADLAVSHLHAVLLRDGDGWTVVDLGSYNGTRLDGERLRPNTPEPFAVGSRLNLGAWTAIRLERSNPEGVPR